MKAYVTLIEPTEFGWSEAKASCYGRDSCAASAYVRGACERCTNLAGTDNGVLHKILQSLSGR